MPQQIDVPGMGVVEFPDGMTDDQIVAAIKANMGPLPEVSTAGDVAKSAGIGLVKGGVGLAGLPADAIDLATRGIDYMAGTKTNEAVGKPAADYAGSQALKGYLEKGIGTKLYEPKTTAGQFAQTVGEFAPAAIGGPGSLAARVATRAVIPGVASEAAGQLTQDTELEPYARVVGALGGAVAGGRIAAAQNRPAAAAVPTAEQVANARRAGYQNPVVEALEIRPQAVEQFTDNVRNALRRDRLSERQAGQTYDALETLRVPEFGANHRLADFDATRRLLNNIAGNINNPTDAEAARRAIRAIDAFTLRVPQSAVVAGDARAAGRELFSARANAAANFRSERVTDAIERAVNTAAATHSGGNLQNEIQKQLRNILNNPRMTRGMNDAELEALRRAARGTTLSNLARRVGKVLGGGGGLGQLAAGSAGGALAGFGGMFALPAVGIAANRIGSALTRRQAEQAAELMRARSPLYGQQNLADYLARLNYSARPEITNNALRAFLLSSSAPQLSYQR